MWALLFWARESVHVMLKALQTAGVIWNLRQTPLHKQMEEHSFFLLSENKTFSLSVNMQTSVLFYLCEEI